MRGLASWSRAEAKLIRPLLLFWGDNDPVPAYNIWCKIGVILRPSSLSVLVSFRRFWHNDPGGPESMPCIHPLREDAAFRAFRSPIGGEKLQNADELARENEALRDRLSRLSEASLRINQSLDLDTVLQGVLDSARSLTGARYGVLTLLDDSGGIRDFLSSGMTAEEAGQLWDLQDGLLLFEYLNGISEPLRLPDLLGHIRSLGLPEFRPPLALGPVVSFLAAPVLHRGKRAGNVYVAEKEAGVEFTREDEETLVMFASQAALVIANARTHREEQRARTDLETLIDTSPVGVAVFDARTGAPVSFNREARRIVDGTAGAGPVAGATAGGADRPARRRAGGLPHGIAAGPGA